MHTLTLVTLCLEKNEFWIIVKATHRGKRINVEKARGQAYPYCLSSARLLRRHCALVLCSVNGNYNSRQLWCPSYMRCIQAGLCLRLKLGKQGTTGLKRWCVAAAFEIWRTLMEWASWGCDKCTGTCGDGTSHHITTGDWHVTFTKSRGPRQERDERKFCEQLCRAQTRKRPSLHFPLFVFLSLSCFLWLAVSLAAESVYWGKRKKNGFLEFTATQMLLVTGEGGIRDQTCLMSITHHWPSIVFHS